MPSNVFKVHFLLHVVIDRGCSISAESLLDTFVHVSNLLHRLMLFPICAQQRSPGLLCSGRAVQFLFIFL